MKTVRQSLLLGTLAAVGLLLAGCSQLEPARTAIAGVESAISAASAEAGKYIPSDLEAANGKLAELKKAFDAKDYKSVIASAPAALESAKGLVAAAAAKKDEVVKMATADWGTLSASLPGMVQTLTTRVNTLGKSKSPPAGYEAAKMALSEATEGWTQAQAAQAAGNVEDAAALARTVKDKAAAAFTALGMQMPGA
jgi:hypothetical protein